MAHTKAKGSTKLGRDSESKRLGVKKFDGEIVKPGDIVIRQRGTKFYPGENARRGGDDTIYSIVDGKVKFSRKRKIHFDGSKKTIKLVNIIPSSVSQKR